MILTLRLLIFFSLFSSTVFAQSLRRSSDCHNAVEYDYKRFSSLIPPPRGFGDVKEIEGVQLYNKHFFTEEHNSYWFYVTFEYDTEFEMILTPEFAEDDYDFLFFIDTIPNFCDSVKMRAFKPARTNISRINPEEGSVTGLKKGFANEFVTAGKGDAFSKPLYAKKNQKYFIVIDCPYGCEGGFYLNFYYNGRNEQGESLDDRQSRIKQKRLSEGRRTKIHQMKIEVYNEDSVLMKNVELSLDGLLPEDKFFQKEGVFVVSPVQHFRTYKMRLDKQGYKQVNLKYTHVYDQDTTLRIYLEKLSVGSSLTFSDIQFVPDKATILPSALKDFEDLLNFLKTNKNISVEIEGHVNGVGGKKRKQMKLSTERAKTIYKLLIHYGIEESRLTYRGYGGDKMIYPEPINEQQSQINRRVEVRVTSIQ